MASNHSVFLLRKAHDRASFDCGIESLNVFLKQHALQNSKAGYSKTYVMLADGVPDVMAYYTICAGEFACALLPPDELKKVPQYPVPVVRLCRLATDVKYQKLGLGSAMLVDALRRAVQVSNHIGVRAVEVDALGDRARIFYQNFGFIPLTENQNHLYISIQSAKQLVDEL